jgi:hypothetical protein
MIGRVWAVIREIEAAASAAESGCAARGHAVVRNDSRGHRIVKEHKDSTRRIDLAVAAVMAFAAASTVEVGPQLFVFDEPAA